MAITNTRGETVAGEKKVKVVLASAVVLEPGKDGFRGETHEVPEALALDLKRREKAFAADSDEGKAVMAAETRKAK